MTAVEQLATAIEKHRPDYLKKLNRGVTPAEIKKAEAAMGRAIPAPLLELLRWRNGQPEKQVIRGPYFMNQSRLIPAKDIAAITIEMDGLLKAGDFEGKVDWWHPGWVPFLADAEDNYLCIDLVGAFGGTPGQILEFNHDGTSREIVAPDFDSWLRAFAGSLEAGLWEETDWGVFETTDEDALTAFLEKALPGYPIEKNAIEHPPARAEKEHEAISEPPAGSVTKTIEMSQALAAEIQRFAEKIDQPFEGAAVRRMAGTRELLKLLALIEWDTKGKCPVCRCSKPRTKDQMGHTTTCKINTMFGWLGVTPSERDQIRAER